MAWWYVRPGAVRERMECLARRTSSQDFLIWLNGQRRELSVYPRMTYFTEEDYTYTPRHEEAHEPSSLSHRMDSTEGWIHGVFQRGIPD